MPSLDIFCLRIFIAFSRLSRTSTSTGFPNVFSIGTEVGTRSGRPDQAPPLLLGSVLVEQRDRQAVELRVRRLRDDLVDDLVLGMAANPVGNELTQELAFFGLRRREHLHTRHVDHAAPLILRSLYTRHGSLPLEKRLV